MELLRQLPLEGFNNDSYKLVDLSSYADIPGAIISANVNTGEASLMVAGETKPIKLGPHRIAIVAKSTFDR